MEKIAFLGKGGIGKSTILANVSVLYSRMGRRVLHVGCDPKHDSSILFTHGLEVPTVVDQIVSHGRIREQEVLLTGREGIDFIEAGGPEPGVGCAGRGIAKTLEFLESSGLLERRRYDVVLFDLLGDIVCGGFGTPLRKGFGRKVVIVVSEELLSLYAANNIARAVVNTASNGVVLAGLVANLRDDDADVAMIERFALALGTRVLAVLRRDPAFRVAEYERLTLAEHDPGSESVERMSRLASAILEIDPGRVAVPTPLADRVFYERSGERFG
jgi:nitrogenase subunit NifH